MNSRVHQDPALEAIVLFFLIKVKHRIKCDKKIKESMYASLFQSCSEAVWEAARKH